MTKPEKSLESTQRRYRLGAASYYDLVIAQQQRLQTEFDLTEGQAKRLVNTVAFYQAMGGGLNGIIRMHWPCVGGSKRRADLLAIVI